jgi:hypothetical protein
MSIFIIIQMNVDEKKRATYFGTEGVTFIVKCDKSMSIVNQQDCAFCYTSRIKQETSIFMNWHKCTGLQLGTAITITPSE